MLQSLLGPLHPRGGALLPQLGRPVSLLLLAHLGAFAARALRAGAQPLELRDALAVEHHAVRVWTLAELGGVAKARRPVGVTRARHPGEVEDEPADGALAIVRAVRVARGKQTLRVVQGVQRGVHRRAGRRSRGVRLGRRAIRLGFDPRRRPRVLRVLSRHGCGGELPRRVPSGAHDAVGEKLLAGAAFLVGQPSQVSDEPPGGFLRGRIRRGDAEQLVVAEHRGFAVEPVPLHAVAPEPEPVRRGEVDRLGDVETGVESAVVRLGEGDHEFTRVLIRPVHGDALADQERGREHGDELEEQIGLSREQVGHRLLEALLERVRGGAGNPVPGLGRAHVVVVDAVQHVVLKVPAKGRKRAADVEPRDDHARDVVVDLTEQARVLALRAGQVVEVPRVLRGGVVLIRSLSGPVVGVPGSGERAAVDAGVQVRAVVHVHGLAAALLHHLPEGFLDVRDRDRLVLAEELRVETSALLLELLDGERLARVEPDVLGVVRGGDAVGTEPVALGELIQRR